MVIDAKKEKLLETIKYAKWWEVYWFKIIINIVKLFLRNQNSAFGRRLNFFEEMRA